MTRLKSPPFILTLIFAAFLILFISQSVITMINVPFYDFDEAHRAENAKKMAEYKSYFVPLTGSSFDRVESLKIPLKENPDFYLYYHLERPPLIYILMFISAGFFGSFEWAYRLPSFLFGLFTIASLIFFARKAKGSLLALSIGLLALLTSSDLWLSSQYAQMDTGITFFLTISLLTLLYFAEKRKNFLIYLSGIFFGFGLLSKLQPAVIFIFPLLGLLVLKKISFIDLLKFIFGSLLVFLPWLSYLAFKFGLIDVIKIMSGFALSSASIMDMHQKAPFFWYVRWWWEVFRPGWTIFLGLFFFDFVTKNITWKKITLIFYIFGGLLAFSIPINKIWWYVLPLIPAVCFYIFLSVDDYLKNNPKSIVNLSFAIIITSLPIFLKSSNTISLIYGFLITTIVFLILNKKINLRISLKFSEMSIFYLSIILSLLLFFLQFPVIIPYHRNAKEVALYYKSLSFPKCLWLGDMPAEAVLFYSNAGVVPILNQHTQIFVNCKNNYLITPDDYDGELVFRKGNIRLFYITQDSSKLSE